MKPKILLYDIEVSRDVVEGYGNKYEFKVVKTIRHQQLMSFAWKWLDDKKIHYIDRHHFDNYADFVQRLRDILDEADIAIAHNGNKFDRKMANRFFVKSYITPPSPYKNIDTLQVARGEFKFQSNSLRDLAEFLDIGTKETITYADLEDDFMTDNPSLKTRKLMEKYNKKDVELLEAIYLRLRPFIKNHPNIGDILHLHGACPKCGSTDLQKRGFNNVAAGPKQRYQCMNCFGWCSEATIKQLGRVVNT
jgi:hypothetical protein